MPKGLEWNQTDYAGSPTALHILGQKAEEGKVARKITPKEKKITSWTRDNIVLEGIIPSFCAIDGR